MERAIHSTNRKQKNRASAKQLRPGQSVYVQILIGQRARRISWRAEIGNEKLAWVKTSDNSKTMRISERSKWVGQFGWL